MSSKLDGVHPDLQQRVPKIIQAMAVLGFEMRVTDGVRTQEQQYQLWRQGRQIPGPFATPERPLGSTVTALDGVAKKSNHQPVGGFGRAVDMTFWVNGVPSWADDLPWRCFGECAKALGLKWGGDWKDKQGRPKPDNPHIELT